MATSASGTSPLSHALQSLGVERPAPAPAPDPKAAIEDLARQTGTPANVLMALAEADGGDLDRARRNADFLGKRLAGGAKLDDVVAEMAGDAERGAALMSRSYDIADALYPEQAAPKAAPGIGTDLKDLGKLGVAGAVNMTGGALQALGAVADDAIRAGARDEIEASGGDPAQVQGESIVRSGSRAAADAVRGAGDAVAGSISDRMKQAMEGTQFQGELFSPSTWSAGDDPSIRGVLGHTAQGLGSMIPVAAASAVAGPTGAAVMGGLGAAGEGAQSGRDFVQAARGRDGEAGPAAIEAMPAFRALLDQGLSPDEAAAELAGLTESEAAAWQAIPGTVGGAATGKILSRAEGMLNAGGRAARAAKKGLAGAIEEGAQEAAEGMASQQGIAAATGADVNTQQDSFGNFVLGALSGGVMGAGAGLVGPGQTDSEQSGDATGDAPLGDGDSGGPDVPLLPAPENGGTIFGMSQSKQEPGSFDRDPSNPNRAAADQSGAGAQFRPSEPPPAGNSNPDAVAEAERIFRAQPDTMDLPADAPIPPEIDGEFTEIPPISDTGPDGSGAGAVAAPGVAAPLSGAPGAAATTPIPEPPAGPVERLALGIAAATPPAPAARFPDQRPGSAVRFGDTASGQIIDGVFLGETEAGARVRVQGREIDLTPEQFDALRDAAPQIEDARKQDEKAAKDAAKAKPAQEAPADVEPVSAAQWPEQGAGNTDVRLGNDGPDLGAGTTPGGAPVPQGLQGVQDLAGGRGTAAGTRNDNQQDGVGGVVLADDAGKLGTALTNARASGEVEHVTKNGKTKTGYVLQGVTKAEADKIDAYSFRKNGGFFVNTDRADEWAAKAPAAPASNPIAQAATEADPAPTEAQKEAGNYRKGHARWNGLDLSIENAKGSERRGKGPDGAEWSVTMPADYGYFRGTEGADGDHVDFYMGDVPDSDYVLIVDQVDADTGKFDEHKVITGTTARGAALGLYRDGFSDGRGDARIGAMTETTVEGMKAWLKGGQMRRPAAGRLDYPFKGRAKAQAKKAAADAAGRDKPAPERAWGNAPAPQKRPLIQYVAKAIGGIDPNGTIAAELNHRGITTRTAPGLFRKGGHMDLDNVPASEHPDLAALVGTDDTGNYLDAGAIVEGIAEEVAGRPQPLGEQAELQERAQAVDNALAHIRDQEADHIIVPRGDDPRGATERKDAIARALDDFLDKYAQDSLTGAERKTIIETLNLDGGEIENAVEDAIMRRPLDEPGTAEGEDADIPFGDVGSDPQPGTAGSAPDGSEAEAFDFGRMPSQEPGTTGQGEVNGPAGGSENAALAGSRGAKGGRRGNGRAPVSVTGPQRPDSALAEGVAGGGEPTGSIESADAGGAGPVGSVVSGNDGRPEGGNEPGRSAGAGSTRLARPQRDKPVAPTGRPDYVLTDPERIVGGGPKARFARNRAALEAMQSIESEGRDPTPEELDSIAGYIGWGSFGQELFQGSWERPIYRDGWKAENDWLREHFGEAKWKSAQGSIINAHYTDPPTVMAMWDMVRAMGFKGGRVLEPSMGIGNFFSMMPADLAARSDRTGIELDKQTGAMAKLLFPHANISIKGYQDSATPDDFYDLVIGNWPFASQSPADRRYDRLGPSLHDYFFLKALDQTRPGGLVVGITSAGTMDKKGRATRIELAKKADLVAAYRLPSGAFEGYAGTSVVTDIIILKKRAEPNANAADEAWIGTADYAAPAGTIHVNRYFLENPDNVLGRLDFGTGSTYGRAAMIVHRPADLFERLNAIRTALPSDAFTPISRGNEPRFIQNMTTDRQGSITTGPDGKNLYVVQGERLVNLSDVTSYEVKDAKETESREKQIRSLVDMRRAYGALLDAERLGEDAETPRKRLKELFDAFRKAFGTIADSFGIKVLGKVNDPFAPALRSLERPDGTPATILTRSTMRGAVALENPTVADAYALNRNQTTTLDMEAVAKAAGVSVEDATDELVEAGAVLRIPGGGVEPKDTYLSGNVRRKLREVEADMEANPAAPPAWLRHGAPVGTDVFVEGKPREVQGHRWTNDGYFVVTEEGLVPYLEAKAENGTSIYDEHEFESPVKDSAAKVDEQRQADEKESRFRRSEDMTPADARAVNEAARAELEKVGLAGRVSVEATAKGRAGVTGSYLGGVIRIIRPGGNWKHTLDHEIIHALRDPSLWGARYGMFTAEEWHALVKAARADKGIRDRVTAAYGDLDTPAQSEEMVAELYADWAKARRETPPGPLRSAFEKVRSFFRAVASALRGEGFVDAASIMEGIANGETLSKPPSGHAGPGGGRRQMAPAEQRESAKEQRDMGVLKDALSSGVGRARGMIGNLHWKNAPGFFSSLLTDAMGKNDKFNVLSLVPGRALFDELGRGLPAAQKYLREKEAMDAWRNDWQARAAKVVDGWTATARKDPQANDSLMDLMHSSTLAGVDPSREGSWKRAVDDEARRALAGGRLSPERQEWADGVIRSANDRERMWHRLKAQYDALPSDFRDLFQKVRDEYAAMSDEQDAALMQNIRTASRIALKRADRELRKEMQRIKDEGLTGITRDEAIDKATQRNADAHARAARGGGARIQQLRQVFESNRVTGPYFPLARFGNYFVTIRDDKGAVISFSRFQTEREQRKWMEQAKERALGEIEHGVLGGDANLKGKVDPKFVAEVESLLADAGASGEMMDAVWQRWLETLPDQSVRTSRIHRKGRDGFNQDAIRAFSSAMFHGAHQTARLRHGLEMEDMLDDAEEQAKKQPDPNRAGFVVREMRQRHAFTMQPTNNAIVSWASGLAFTWYLAASPAAALVNLSQTTIVGVPLMAARFKGAGVTGVSRELGRALADFGKGKGWAQESGRLSQDERAAMKAGYDRGVIDKTQSHDLAAVAESGIEYNPTREKVMRVLSWGFHHTERLNREVTYLAAYRLARSEGAGHMQAVDEASKQVWRAHFSYQNCVDEDTEALTTRGWLRWNELQPGDRIMSVDDMGRAVETGVKAVNVFEKEQEIMLFSAGGSRNFSMAVTPDHKCVIQRTIKSDGIRTWGKVAFVEAQNVKASHQLLRVPTAPLDGRDVGDGNDFAALLGWIAAEGSYGKHRGTSKKHHVKLMQSAQHNPEYVAEIDSLWQRLGAPGSRHVIRGGEMVMWSFREPLSGRIRDAMPEKRLTWDMVSRWTAEEMSACLDAFCKGDGTRRPHGAWTITQKASTNRQNLDVLQAMATAIGRLSSVGEGRTRDHAWLILGGKNGKRTHAAKLTTSKITVPMVWCPTTGNGRWIARRHGQVFVTGNTDRPRVMQSDMGKILTTFRNFTVNMLYRLFRDAHQSFAGADAETRREARAQLIGISLSMFAHAGIKGVWGYGLLSMLLGALLPGDDDDFDNWLQDALLIEGDSAGTAAWNWTMGMVLNGVPGTVLDTDLTGRIGMPDLWFRGSQKDLEGKDLWSYYVEQVAGPVAGIGGSVATGLSMIADGEWQRGAEKVVPKFAANLVKSARYVEDGVTTYNGDSIIDSVNPYEALTTAMGFTPARVAERYRANTWLKNQEAKITSQRKSLMSDIGKSIKAGNGVTPELAQQVKAWNIKYPFYPITASGLRQSMASRQRLSNRSEGGVTLNPRLDQYLRTEVAPAYR